MTTAVDFYLELSAEERTAFHAKRLELKNKIKELAGRQKEDRIFLRAPHQTHQDKASHTQCDMVFRAKRITELLLEYHEHRRTGRGGAHVHRS